MTSAILENLLSRLEGVKQTGHDTFIAKCSAHNDRSPSLSIKADCGMVALHCHAGCNTEQVLAAVGLSFSDLYEPREVIYSDRKGGGKRVRREMRFPAADCLRAVGRESLIVAAAVAAVCDGKPLQQVDRDRVMLAAARIQSACNAAGVA